MINKEYKSFFKTVSGNEGNKCHYPTRLDSYGCGCTNNCSYCYAKSLLSFRKLWDPQNPAVADIGKVIKTIEKHLNSGDIVRLGGMTDCFQPLEKTARITYQVIEELNKRDIGYLIVTKCHLVAEDDYVKIMRRDLAHIQISITSTDDDFSKQYEHTSSPSERIRAIEKLQREGFDVQVRLSPFIPQFIGQGHLDLDTISNIECDKILIEFLRVNSWIKKWFSIDYDEYTVKENGYLHMPLETKLRYISMIKGFKEISVCEDESHAYEYWKTQFNKNPEDCCNLRIE